MSDFALVGDSRLFERHQHGYRLRRRRGQPTSTSALGATTASGPPPPQHPRGTITAAGPGVTIATGPTRGASGNRSI